jgi:glycosyltransferase involved in cell wall biosynthesis
MDNYTDKKVSVIMPSFNHGQFIEDAVRSVLCQTHEHLELIVVDDGSKDDSVEVLRAVEDPRLRVVQQRNQGAHVAINNGLALATGEFLCILNSDDVLHPLRIDRALKVFREDSHAKLVCSSIDIVDDLGKRLDMKRGWLNCEPWPLPDPNERVGAAGSFYSELMIANFVASTSNIVMARDLWNLVGPMRPLRFVHDWDFLIRAASRFRCVLIDEPLLQYRIHGRNTIRSNRSEMIFEILWIWATHLATFEDHLLQQQRAGNSNFKYDVLSLYHSLNCHGCDRIFWAIRSYIEALRRNGVTEPELALLQDKKMKAEIISVIDEVHVVAFPRGLLGRIRVLLSGIARNLRLLCKA